MRVLFVSLGLVGVLLTVGPLADAGHAPAASAAPQYHQLSVAEFKVTVANAALALDNITFVKVVAPADYLIAGFEPENPLYVLSLLQNQSAPTGWYLDPADSTLAGGRHTLAFKTLPAGLSPLAAPIPPGGSQEFRVKLSGYAVGLAEGGHAWEVRAVAVHSSPPSASLNPLPVDFSSRGALATTVLDKTPPIITLQSRTPANSHGWNKGDVTVTWTCTDALSGATSPTVTAVVATEGAGQSATGTCTDKAGNTASDTVGNINIDKANPSIAFETRTPANAEGWNKEDVTVTWTCSDALSGPAAATVSSVVATQGAGQSVTGTCTDKAGNTASDTVGNINIDKANPSIAFETRTLANAEGWNKEDVTVTWTCSDALSGAAAATVSAVVSGEGAAQSASGTCTDKAGNTATDTVGNVNIDKTNPSITGSRTPAANTRGWNANVIVSFECSDERSGVASVSGPTNLSTDGSSQSVTGDCTDKAGNSASITMGGINIDKTNPSITSSRTPVANDHGWNNGDVNVTWHCSDALSGVASVSGSEVFTAEGDDQNAAGTCTDKADNRATSQVGPIRIDKTNPSITGSRTPAANANGWNNANVIVSFACTDAGSGVANRSGVASVSGPTNLSTDGSSQSVTGDCADKAGNSASITMGGINIDKTAPALTEAGPLGQVPAGAAEIRVKVSDAGRLDAGSPAVMVDGQPVSGAELKDGFILAKATLGPGKHSLRATLKDLAGNEGAASWTVSATEAQVSLTAEPASPNGQGGWYRSAPVVRVQCQPAQATCQLGLDGTLSLVASGAAITVPEGVHTVAGRSELSGQPAAEGALSISVDSQPPVLTLEAPQGAQGKFQAKVRVEEAGSGLAEARALVTRPGASAAEALPLGVPVELGPAPGAYKFQVTAKDRAGHEASLERVVHINTIPPTAKARAGKEWFRDALAVQAEVQDDAPGAQARLHYRFSRDGSTWGAWTTFATGLDFQFPGPEGEGRYEFAAVGVDVAGNVESKELKAEASARRDTTSPQLRVATDPPARQGWSNLAPRVTATTTDEAPVTLEARVCAAACPDFAPLPAQGLLITAEGRLRAEVRATDAAGNAALAPLELQVDATPPRLGFEAAVHGATVRLDALGTTDALSGVASLRWEFDDGTSTEDWVATKTFPQAGEHEVTLRARDHAGNEAREGRRLVTEQTLEPPEEAVKLLRVAACALAASGPAVAGAPVIIEARGCPQSLQEAEARALLEGIEVASFQLTRRGDALVGEFTPAQPGSYQLELLAPEPGAAAPLVVGAARGFATPAPEAALVVLAAGGLALARRRR